MGLRMSTLPASSAMGASRVAVSNRMAMISAMSGSCDLDEDKFGRPPDPHRNAAGAKPRRDDQMTAALDHQSMRPAQRRFAGVDHAAEGRKPDLATVGVAGQRQERPWRHMLEQSGVVGQHDGRPV